MISNRYLHNGEVRSQVRKCSMRLVNAHILEEPDSHRLHYRAALSHEYVLTGNRYEN